MHFFIFSSPCRFSSYALIFFTIVVFAIKYRRRAEDERPEPIEGNLWLEVVWSVIPFGLTMVMFVWGAIIFFDIYNPPNDALEISIVGRQWMWKAQHPTGQSEINELHVPLGQPVKLMMTSEDVIHDFFLPAFRVKQDVLPGRYTSVWFEATKAGVYHLFCAEYCGTQHSGMIGRVVVLEPVEFEKWLSGGATGMSIVDLGASLFQRLGCHTCHRAGGTKSGSFSRGPLRGNSETPGGQYGERGRGLHSGVDLRSSGENRCRISADHADVQGPGERRGNAPAHCLHQILA